MSQWVIYWNPRDYPGLFVVREHKIGPGWHAPVPECKTARTLEEARKLIPPGFTWLPRNPADDSPIVEIWI